VNVNELSQQRFSQSPSHQQQSTERSVLILIITIINSNKSKLVESQC